ncbi:YopX family protein [Flavobacterium sp. 102]|uniref:YopX family protein n=1 Tax=Flavobacterium sp. 102 TaxID=2135623 RepID=UPI000EB42DD7|nr:YopX family protein [Flavobacterium sp. 102]RKS00402.1 putative phage protein (TIGR01671 family) [Flavobacterium sp. 102]RKS03728.1 putative phage protein (TIGR01671 family) [Flavobacterium sp. 102]
MDTIKFRGKRIDNGQWVEGHYFVTPLTDENSGTQPDAGWFFLTGDKRHCISNNGVVFVVHENTVSQFINISDKKGKEVFEKDIIQTPNGDWGMIKYDGIGFGVTVSETHTCYYTVDFITNSEVVANIDDNPDFFKTH